MDVGVEVLFTIDVPLPLLAMTGVEDAGALDTTDAGAGVSATAADAVVGADGSAVSVVGLDAVDVQELSRTAAINDPANTQLRRLFNVRPPSSP